MNFVNCLALTFCDVIDHLLPERTCLTLQDRTIFCLTSNLADKPVSKSENACFVIWAICIGLCYVNYNVAFHLLEGHGSRRWRDSSASKNPGGQDFLELETLPQHHVPSESRYGMKSDDIEPKIPLISHRNEIQEDKIFWNLESSHHIMSHQNPGTVWNLII